MKGAMNGVYIRIVTYTSLVLLLPYRLKLSPFDLKIRTEIKSVLLVIHQSLKPLNYEKKYSCNSKGFYPPPWFHDACFNYMLCCEHLTRFSSSQNYAIFRNFQNVYENNSGNNSVNRHTFTFPLFQLKQTSLESLSYFLFIFCWAELQFFILNKNNLCIFFCITYFYYICINKNII